MTKEAKLKVHISNKTLWITLGVLLLAMTCLIIGIVAVGIRNGKGLPAIGDNSSKEDFSNIDSGVEEEDKVDRTAYSGDHAEEVALTAEINNAIAPLNTEDSINYLNQEQEKYIGTEMESRIKIMKVWVYYNDKQPEQALETSKDIDEDSLGDWQKIDYYEAMVAIYNVIGPQETLDEYKDKWSDLSAELHDNEMFNDEDIEQVQEEEENYEE